MASIGEVVRWNFASSHRRQRLGLGQRDRERIAMRAVDAEFVMQMRAGGEAGHADEADGLALRHALADFQRRDLRHVSIQRAVVAAVLQDHHVAVAALPTLERDFAFARRMDRRAGRRCVVDAADARASCRESDACVRP